MKDFYPKVTIVIPVYNGSKHLSEAIDSALSQTYKNIEIIVSDDGSNDNGATKKVAKSYGNKIVFITKKENGGASTALNAAIKLMTGDYFSWLSHDDLYYPNKIQRQVEELAKLEDKNTVMMSDLDGINERREKIYQTNYMAHIEAYPLRESSLLHPVVYNQTHGCTLLIPKSCFDDVGHFDVDERVAQDFECFYRIFKKYPHKLVPEILVTARDTSNRMGRRAKPRADTEYSRLYINILENLSVEEIKLLAKDKVTLLFDMWGFFKAAGYTIAQAYVTERIVDYAGDFCEEQVDLYLRSQSEQNALMTILKEVEVRLGLLFEDKRQAARYIDSAIRDYVIKESRAVIVNAQSKAVVLLDLLLKLEYKQSAAHLLSQIVGILGNERKKKQLDKILTDKIIGDEKLLEENAIYSFSNKKSNNKNRIMFCSTHWLTGGMERVLSLVFEQLKEKYEIYLFTPSDGRAYEIKLPNYVNHVKISNAVFYKDFDFAALTAAILLRVDVLVGFYNLFEKQLNLYSLCNSEGIKTVASNHEYFYYPYLSYDFQDLAIKRLDAFKKVDAVLWPTNFSAAACALGCENSYLMPNPNTFTVTNVSEKEKENIIICAGRFNDYIKRIDRILQCFKIVQDRLPNSKLMIVGDCDRQKKNKLFGGKTINDIIIDLGLDENNLIFTGNVSNMADYYKQAKVLVLASGSEGFGMVINEAASFGVPTVYNYIPGLEDLVTNGKNGFVVEQDDISTMAEKLVIILTDKKVFTKLSAGATQLVKRFDAITIGQRWTYLIDNLLEHRDSSNLHKSLRNKLSYTISDQKQFSKIIFSEFDRTTRKLVGLNSTSTVAVGSPSYLERFARSLRVNGRKRTIRKILGRVYKRIKSNT